MVAVAVVEGVDGDDDEDDDVDAMIGRRDVRTVAMCLLNSALVLTVNVAMEAEFEATVDARID